MYNNSYQELYHHGILGQKWGVRRYQNYDGSYTQAGLKRYNSSKEAYENAKTNYKNVKNDKSRIKSAKEAYNKSFTENQKSQGLIRGDKEKYRKAMSDRTALKNEKAVYKKAVSDSKKQMKSTKKQMNKDYDHLKMDKLGDQGKELYAKGKTITGNESITSKISASGIVISAGAQFLKQSGMLDQKTADILSIVGVGISAASTIKSGRDYVQAKKLRAYYGHSSNY